MNKNAVELDNFMENCTHWFCKAGKTLYQNNFIHNEILANIRLQPEVGMMTYSGYFIIMTWKKLGFSYCRVTSTLHYCCCKLTESIAFASLKCVGKIFQGL